jgi:hypothetical protein
MKVFQIVFFLTIAASSCLDKKGKIINKDITFLNENFLTIVDTLAYKYNTLLPVPYQSERDNKDSFFNVTIYDKLISPLNWEKETIVIINKSFDSARSLEYKKMLFSYKADGDTASYNIDIKKITNHGQYNLIPNKEFSIRKIENKQIIGHLVFSRIVFNSANDKAIIIAVIKDNIKSGIIKIYFFEKQKSNWKIYHSDILEAW